MVCRDGRRAEGDTGAGEMSSVQVVSGQFAIVRYIR